MTTDAQMTPDNPLAEYWTEDQMAELRKKTPRTLRAERQRGDGPPWVRDGRTILYWIPGYGRWLTAKTRQPVRAGCGR